MPNVTRHEGKACLVFTCGARCPDGFFFHTVCAL